MKLVDNFLKLDAGFEFIFFIYLFIFEGHTVKLVDNFLKLDAGLGFRV